MNYEKYLELFYERMNDGKLPETIKPMSEKEFNHWYKFMMAATQIPEIKEDGLIRLSYKEIYLRIRKLIENGDSSQKKEMLKTLDEDYAGAAKNLNLN